VRGLDARSRAREEGTTELGLSSICPCLDCPKGVEGDAARLIPPRGRLWPGSGEAIRVGLLGREFAGMADWRPRLKFRRELSEPPPRPADGSMDLLRPRLRDLADGVRATERATRLVGSASRVWLEAKDKGERERSPETIVRLLFFLILGAMPGYACWYSSAEGASEKF